MDPYRNPVYGSVLIVTVVAVIAFASLMLVRSRRQPVRLVGLAVFLLGAWILQSFLHTLVSHAQLNIAYDSPGYNFKSLYPKSDIGLSKLNTVSGTFQYMRNPLRSEITLHFFANGYGYARRSNDGTWTLKFP